MSKALLHHFTILFISIFLCLPAAHAQFTQPNGTVIGNQTVIPIPIAPPGFGLHQALIYYPDDYFKAGNEHKYYPLYVFLHGAGEGRTEDITEVTNQSLPWLIKNGLKPYGIDSVTGDTVKFIVVSPHADSTGWSYTYPQLQYTIPYLFTAFRVDTTCVFVGGLSAGGGGAWSVAMGFNGPTPPQPDTILARRITGIMPMANGGYDDAMTKPTMAAALDTNLRRGLAVLYIIGDQDPGYNALGYQQYAHADSTFGIPGRWFHKVIAGGAHDSGVWNRPFPENARVWSTTQNAWTQMWNLRKGAPNTGGGNPPPPSGNVVRKVACTEYKASWMYADSTVRSFIYNTVSGHVELMTYNLNGRKAVDASTGFNVVTILDDQGYVWLGNAGSNTATRWNTDTTGAPFNNNKAIYGYFSSYLSIRNDGSIWYWGNDSYNFYGGATINSPVKLHAPAGVQFTKLAMGTSLMGLSTTGNVYIWDTGDSNYHQVVLPRPASDIAASRQGFFVAVVPDNIAVSTMGYPYAFGPESRYYGTTTQATYTAPLACKGLWGMTVPIKEISANQNTIHFIDSLGNLYGMGDNAQGEVGNGQELVNHAEQYATPYAWSWVKYGLMVSTPVQIGAGTKFKKLFTGSDYVFYNYALDVNDSLYFWGRNKSFVGGDGAVNNQEGTLPNAMDILKPTLRTPIAISPTQTTSYNFTPYTLKATPAQTIASAGATLSATSTPSLLVSPGKPNYGYTITKYHWTKFSGPSAYTITTPDSLTTTVTGLTTGTYIFTIQTTDNNTATISANDTIVVASHPVANAGADQTITLPTDSVTLAGTGTETNGTIVSYKWTQISGSTAAVIDFDSHASTNVSGLVTNSYLFKLTVTDSLGATAVDTVKVTVNPAPPGTPVFIVSAGPDKTITLPTNSLTITGVATVQNATVATCRWTQISGPSTATLTGTGSISPTASNLVAGVYTFQVKITSTTGLSDSDRMNVIVDTTGGSSTARALLNGNGSVLNPDKIISLYPNPVPADQVLTLEGRNWGAGQIKINIYDISGHRVRQILIDGAESHFRQSVPLRGLKRGAYLLSIESADGKKPTVLRFIVQ